MPPIPVLTTAGLCLREWRDDDLAAFAALNADPRVMEHFPKLLSRDESDATAARIREHFARHGFGLWAVEVVGVADFIGFVGLSVPAFEAPFTPCVEIGWRLACEHWGRGYATEAVRAALGFGFESLELEEIVSFTVAANQLAPRHGAAGDEAVTRAGFRPSVACRRPSAAAARAVPASLPSGKASSSTAPSS